MTKETPRIVNIYRVQVDYRADGRDTASTVFTFQAARRREATAAGRHLFDAWVQYNKGHGFLDFTDLTVTRVTCRFVESRTA